MRKWICGVHKPISYTSPWKFLYLVGWSKEKRHDYYHRITSRSLRRSNKIKKLEKFEFTLFAYQTTEKGKCISRNITKIGKRKKLNVTDEQRRPTEIFITDLFSGFIVSKIEAHSLKSALEDMLETFASCKNRQISVSLEHTRILGFKKRTIPCDHHYINFVNMRANYSNCLLILFHLIFDYWKLLLSTDRYYLTEKREQVQSSKA